MSLKQIILREEKKYLKYWPMVVLYAIILALTFLTYALSEHSHWMMLFMGWTLVIFGILKLEDLDSFADGFKKYDLFASLHPLYAKAYPVIEVILGVLYLLGMFMYPITVIVFVVFSSTAIGLYRRLHKGELIDCLCLGARFKLPLSIVAVLEASLMIGMAAWMLFM